MSEVATKARVAVGIKHPSFHPKRTDGTHNGHSHRKNALKRKAQYLRNQKTRADLYREFQGKNSGGFSNWHTAIEALRKGNA